MSPTELNLEEVFKTEGVPEFTFVRPPNYNEIFLDIRTPGKPVILEGQSGTGKTTCVLRILDDLEVDRPPEYLTARRAVDVSRIEAVIRGPTPGRFIIDDFHRLSRGLQEQIADIAKTSAEFGDGSNLPKLVIIGINQVGSELIQLVPDIAKRTGIHKISPGRPSDISKLIESGCERLNVRIEGADRIYGETRGDYWLTQQICQSICAAADITQTAAVKRSVDFSIQDVRQRVVDRLRASFYPAVKEFGRGRRFRPTNDPYFKLLRAVGQQESSIVDLNEMANSLPDVRGSINNIKEVRLKVLIDAKPTVAHHFYYNPETKSFAIEDPALFYFIKHLDWDQLRKDCGFRKENEDFEFDLALSFAGENRELAQFIADNMTKLDVAVFFDKMFESHFLGKAWSKKFQQIFGKSSRFVVCILDKHHLDKIWPTFEREHFLPRVSDETIIPIYLDDTKFPGIPRDIVGVQFKFDPSDPEWKQKATDEIIMKLIDRVSM